MNKGTTKEREFLDGLFCLKMVLSNTEWRESQKLITEGKIKISLQGVGTIFASPLFDNLSDRRYSIIVSSDELSR